MRNRLLPLSLLVLAATIMMLCIVVLFSVNKACNECVIQAPRYAVECRQYECIRLDTQTGDVKIIE